MNLSIYQSTCRYIDISIYRYNHLSIYQSINLSIYQSINLSIQQSVSLSICLSVRLSIYLSVCLSIYLSTCRSSIYLSIYLSDCPTVYLSICYLSICVSVYLSICLAVYLSICLSVCLSIYLAICRSIDQSINLAINQSIYPSIDDLSIPAEPNVRPRWHNILFVFPKFLTIFSSAILTALQGWTLPTRTTRNSLHGSFHNNLWQQPFADFVRVREKEWPFRARKHRLRANVQFCAYQSIHLPVDPLYQSTHLSINQSTNQSISQSDTYRSVSINHSMYHSIYQAISLSTNQSITQSINLSIYLSFFLSLYVCICVCVDHLHRCKTSFGRSCFSCFYIMFAGGQSHVCSWLPNEEGCIHDWYDSGTLESRTCYFIFVVNGNRLSQVPACRLIFHFASCCIWTFLRTSMSTVFNPLYGFRNLIYCWIRQTEQLLCARTKKKFIYTGFLAYSSNFFLSDFRGLFVHARCTPQQ